MKIPLTLLLILFLKILSAQELRFTKEEHTYLVENLDSYKRMLSIEGINTSAESQFVSIGASEDATVLSYHVYELKDGKWKSSKIGKFVSESTISYGSFFNGSKNYIFEIPLLTQFKIEFNTAQKNTIFISQLIPKGFFDADSVAYNFELPTGLQATMNNGKTFEDNASITAFPDSSKNISILIHPKNEDPEVYFSKWFASRVEPALQMNEKLIPVLLKEKRKTEDSKKFAKSCFEWVTQNIKYVAIENGINALIPRQCEKTIQNGLGDCKDMATLLTAVYKFFGYEAYLGISRTNSKEGVFNFPSVGLANHMICVLKLDNEFVFLDPTEDACIFGDPSIQIFGTETFLISYPYEPFQLVPAVPNSLTELSLHYRIDVSGKKVVLSLQTKGKMNLSYHHLHIKNSDYIGKIKDQLNYLTGKNWSLDSVLISEENSQLVCSTPLSSTDYSNLGSRIVFHMRFLPAAEKICQVFQWNESPLYPSSFKLTMEFLGSQPQSAGQQHTIVEFEEGLDVTKDKKEYENSKFYTQYKSLSTKPMNIQYPN